MSVSEYHNSKEEARPLGERDQKRRMHVAGRGFTRKQVTVVLSQC